MLTHAYSRLLITIDGWLYQWLYSHKFAIFVEVRTGCFRFLTIEAEATIPGSIPLTLHHSTKLNYEDFSISKIVGDDLLSFRSGRTTKGPVFDWKISHNLCLNLLVPNSIVKGSHTAKFPSLL